METTDGGLIDRHWEINLSKNRVHLPNCLAPNRLAPNCLAPVFLAIVITVRVGYSRATGPE
jgi:hypothetical protein